MSAHEVAGPTRTCEQHGQFIGWDCPVCEGVQKPAGRRKRNLHPLVVERALRARPRSGSFEPDPEDD